MNENVSKKLSRFFPDSDRKPANVKRTREFVEMCSTIAGEEANDIFIIASKEDEGAADLWLFSEHYMIEAKDALKQKAIKIIPIRNNIWELSLEPENFDMSSGEYSNTSKLTVSFKKLDNERVEMTANNWGCDALFETFKTHLLPNLKK